MINAPRSIALLIAIAGLLCPELKRNDASVPPFVELSIGLSGTLLRWDDESVLAARIVR